MSSIVTGQSTAEALPSLAPNGWMVVRAPLADRRQGYGCRVAHVYVVDTEVPTDQVEAVVEQLVAATEGRWQDAPHATRPRPTLAYSAAIPLQRTAQAAPTLSVVRGGT